MSFEDGEHPNCSTVRDETVLPPRAFRGPRRSRNDKVLSCGDTGKSDPQSKPDCVDCFADATAELNGTTGRADASEPTETSARRAAASLEGIPAFRSLARDAERVLGSVFRSYDVGSAAQMRQIEQIARAASGADRLSANLQTLSPTLDQALDPRMDALKLVTRSATTNPLMADMERVNRVIRDISRTAMPTASLLAVDQFRFLDKITPLMAQELQLSTSANLARVLFPNTGVETWRMSLLAQSNVARMANGYLADVTPGLLGVLAARTDVAAGLSERLAVNNSGTALDKTTAQTARAWQRYTALKPTAHRLAISAAAGSTVGGLISSDLLLASEDDDAEELAAEIDAQVVGPWHNGTIAARAELHAALRAIDPSIAEFLIGGWEDVERKGASAASKIAHCVVEAIDHTLRAAAPNEATEAWLRRDGRTPARTDFDDKGRPTRRGRIAYALRDRGGDRLLLQKQEAALAALVAQLQAQAQGVKHAPGAATVTHAQTLLVTAEGLLMQLVLP